MAVKRTIPDCPGDLTPEWLGGVLGVEVASAAVTPVGTGQIGATYRVAIVRADGEPADPLVAKLPSQEDEVRARVALGYRAECAFYRDVADTVSVPLPKVYHCDVNDDGSEFVLLMGDLAPAVQGDQLVGGTVAQARRAVEALAGLHGPRWCDPAWADFGWATMPKPDADFARGMGDLARMATNITLEQLGEGLSSDDRATINAVPDLITAC